MNDAQYRKQLTLAIMALLHEWGLSPADIINVLKLDVPTRKVNLYHQGTPFPESKITDERMEHLVGIQDSLRTAYPTNKKMAGIWLRRPHKKFRGKTPLDKICSGALSGLTEVRAEIDCTFAWEHHSSAYT